jgi:hypothetical protein
MERMERMERIEMMGKTELLLLEEEEGVEDTEQDEGDGLLPHPAPHSPFYGVIS